MVRSKESPCKQTQHGTPQQCLQSTRSNQKETEVPGTSHPATVLCNQSLSSEYCTLNPAAICRQYLPNTAAGSQNVTPLETIGLHTGITCLPSDHERKNERDALACAKFAHRFLLALDRQSLRAGHCHLARQPKSSAALALLSVQATWLFTPSSIQAKMWANVCFGHTERDPITHETSLSPAYSPHASGPPQC
eukprot:CAMPEP_0202859536 /NCGR_PEP_ID=MMETSP1391-20130828/1602_1 /ASSEMBLY_ACC=CAM_ASM_000867 /TAXON_ID=1034604 /ORGANISM="Chlamydomonas leiostraca, Strain SAG 11-49" /LENGTH=192 /DNA_ID=CAMNT_0049538573 /DNA_START=393 /DNA_END=971 /DNA_ORIENTATION=-